MTDIGIIYHNASGKRNQMIIDLDEFFPCYKSWMAKLLKIVIDRSDDPDRYKQEIRTYLQTQLDLAEAWLSENSCGPGPMIGVKAGDYKQVQTNIKKLRGCLELIGGADEQRSDINAGKEPARY